jgi:purine-binding chemotaxis protein CheW
MAGTPKKAEAAGRGGKYLTFFFGEEEYGIQILRVREIIGLMPITEVPRTPEYVRGVVNLRGKVIPILELRLRLDLPRVEATEETCVIVVQAGTDQMVGLIVDKVSEVIDISTDEVVDAPSLGDDVNTDYLLGLGKTEGRVRLLLDIDRALDTKELEELDLEAA